MPLLVAVEVTPFTPNARLKNGPKHKALQEATAAAKNKAAEAFEAATAKKSLAESTIEEARRVVAAERTREINGMLDNQQRQKSASLVAMRKLLRRKKERARRAEKDRASSCSARG